MGALVALPHGAITTTHTAGVTVETVYDRSELIHRAIDTLKRTLIEEAVIVALVCLAVLALRLAGGAS